MECRRLVLMKNFTDDVMNCTYQSFSIDTGFALIDSLARKIVALLYPFISGCSHAHGEVVGQLFGGLDVDHRFRMV